MSKTKKRKKSRVHANPSISTDDTVDLNPNAKLVQIRAARRELEETIVYSMLYNKNMDIARREDYKYLREIAEELGWSVSRLQKVLNRIWNDAAKDVRNEARRNKTERNEKTEAGYSKGVCDSSADRRESD